MSIHKCSAEKRWAALTKEQRHALPLEEQAAIRAEIATHNAKRATKNAAYAARRAERLASAEHAASTTLAKIQDDAETTRRLFRKWNAEATT